MTGSLNPQGLEFHLPKGLNPASLASLWLVIDFSVKKYGLCFSSKNYCQFKGIDFVTQSCTQKENLGNLWWPKVGGTVLHTAGPQEEERFLIVFCVVFLGGITFFRHLAGGRDFSTVLGFSSFGRMERFFFGSRIFVIWQHRRQIFVARQENSSFGCWMNFSSKSRKIFVKRQPHHF